MKKILSSFLAIILVVSGCVTPQPSTQKRIEVGVRVAAQIGSGIILTENPELRDGFIRALNDLRSLESSTNALSVSDVLAIVNRLNVKELKSPTAVLYVTTGVLLLNELGVPSEISLEQSQSAKGVAKALADGMEYTLKTLPAPKKEKIEVKTNP